uniref:Secreted protein n=1 Tax=Syphacia muris TaxID=451379 RepID=A0A0N5ARQ9_9BILA
MFTRCYCERDLHGEAWPLHFWARLTCVATPSGSLGCLLIEVIVVPFNCNQLPKYSDHCALACLLLSVFSNRLGLNLVLIEKCAFLFELYAYV